MFIPAVLLLTYGLLPSLVAANLPVKQYERALLLRINRRHFNYARPDAKSRLVAQVNRRYDTTKTDPLEKQINALLIECRRRNCMPPNKDLRRYQALKSVKAYKNRGSDFVERHLRNMLQTFQKFKDSLNARLDNAVVNKTKRDKSRRVQTESEFAKQQRLSWQNGQYAQRCKARDAKRAAEAESQSRKEQQQHAEQRRNAQKQLELKVLQADMATLERKLKSLKELRIEAVKLNKRDLIRRVDETIAEKNGKYHEKLMMVLYDYDDISR